MNQHCCLNPKQFMNPKNIYTTNSYSFRGCWWGYGVVWPIIGDSKCLYGLGPTPSRRNPRTWVQIPVSPPFFNVKIHLYIQIHGIKDSRSNLLGSISTTISPSLNILTTPPQSETVITIAFVCFEIAAAV